MVAIWMFVLMYDVLSLQWIKSFISTKIKTNLGKGAWKIPEDEKGT